MSSTTQASLVIDITNKWELAQRLSGHAKAPEQALKYIFIGSMQQLEEIANSPFEESMKERVWSAVSNDKLKTLKETFMLAFCDKILGSFNEEQAAEMLEEHKSTGAVKNIIYSSLIQSAYFLHQESISESICNKANSMTETWIPEIVEAVISEGIKLPK